MKEYDSDYGRSKKRGGKSKSKPSTSSSKSKSKKKKRARVNYDSHLEDESEEDEVTVLSYNFENKFVDPLIHFSGFRGANIVVKEEERQTGGIRGEQEQAEAKERLLVGRVGHERGRGKCLLFKIMTILVS